MTVFHDSRDPSCRRPFGAAAAGSEVFLSVEADERFRSCEVMLARDGGEPEPVPMARAGGAFSVSFAVPAEGCLLWYWFRLADSAGGEVRLGCRAGKTGGASRTYEGAPAPYQITVYEPSPTPEWFKNAVVYQIFPDSFARGRDFSRRVRAATAAPYRGSRKLLHLDWADAPFYGRDGDGRVIRWPFYGGTLEGIREKLPYLQSLGVTAVYLNPVFMAASSHRYDTADYTRIDPLLGDEDSFRRLMEDGLARGIRFILDGVFSHTGADSVYFDRYGTFGGSGACAGPGSPYADWYRFTDYPARYACWWGVDDLPEVEETEPSYMDFICGENGVIRRWLRLGASGWRLDVADELPDSFIRAVRAAMDAEKPGSLLLGEVWEDASNKISYGSRRAYLLGRELHSTMNYPFRDCAVGFLLGRVSPAELGDTLTGLLENYPPENAYGALNLIGSHDRARILTLLGDEQPPENGAPWPPLAADKRALARRRLLLLSLLQFTVPGVPCVYYGDEAGAEGGEDPGNRAAFPWQQQDGELAEHVRTLAALRRTHPALVSGAFRAEAGTEHVFSFTRSGGGEEVLVLLNRGIFEHETVRIPAGYTETLLSLWSKAPAPGLFTMEPLSALVVRKKARTDA